jgi:hypothetical protein
MFFTLDLFARRGRGVRVRGEGEIERESPNPLTMLIRSLRVQSQWGTPFHNDSALNAKYPKNQLYKVESHFHFVGIAQIHGISKRQILARIRKFWILFRTLAPELYVRSFLPRI